MVHDSNQDFLMIKNKIYTATQFHTYVCDQHFDKQENRVRGSQRLLYLYSKDLAQTMIDTLLWSLVSGRVRNRFNCYIFSNVNSKEQHAQLTS